MGYESPELEEWIPVYGAIFGVFSVRRQLTHAELGRIKQSIFSLENEVRQDTSRKPVALPRLINRYFWLLDHYVNRQEEPGLIEETMLKIKVLDPEIYNLYRQ
jgi:hypothetical protein